MTRERLQELLIEASKESLSWGELIEIDREADKLGIVSTDEWLVSDTLSAIERML